MVKFSAAILIFIGTSLGMEVDAETVLLDFSSPHCGPCRQMEPTIERLEQAGYPVRKVDVTREPGLAAQYRVTRVPCFVMLVDGREVDRVEGATSGERLQQMFSTARPQQIPAVEGRARTQSPDASCCEAEGGDCCAVKAGEDSARSLLGATVRLRVQDASGGSVGTGTIVDSRSGEALIITCGHLFRDSQGKGPVTVELFQPTAEGVQVVEKLEGQVISYDLDRDLGLISIRPGQPVQVAKIALPETAIERGDRVASVGCNHGQDPTRLSTRITAINRYQGPPNIEASGVPVEGRSGGGLFNDRGELIGVCYAADPEGNEGLYAALESIHDELDRIGLSKMLLSTPDRVEPDTSLELPRVAVQGPAAMQPTIIRGQEPLAPITPIPFSHEVAPVGPESAALGSSTSPLVPTGPLVPIGLKPAEQAAWEEIVARTVTSEVVCIIRPKEPGGKSEVITLDDASPEFVRALVSRRRGLLTQ